MRITALLFLAMLLAACGGESEPEPTRAIMPTFTATAALPTVSPATVAPPAIAAPTITPLPILEATPIPNIVPTDTAQPAQVSQGAVTTDVANVRSGPGTDFGVVGSVAAGQSLVIVGRNAAGDWYQLSDGTWIAAFLVTGAPAEIAVVDIQMVEQPASEVINTPIPAPVVEQATVAPVVIVEPTGVAFTCTDGCATPPDPSCAIKGNFNGTNGDRIFHQPGGTWYDKTDIVSAEGDVWFCTVNEAIAAGYREAGK